jgi:flavin reductase (DIM6/NTAB) family NADH-FMN oxidoreductase RutF
VIHFLAPGNHTLFIGEVVQAGRRKEALPLTSLDYSGMYVGKE